MRRVMRNPRKLNMIHYATFLIDLNDYLYALPGAKAGNKIGEMELHEIILNSIPNVQSKKEYVKGFDDKILL